MSVISVFFKIQHHVMSYYIFLSFCQVRASVAGAKVRSSDFTSLNVFPRFFGSRQITFGTVILFLFSGTPIRTYSCLPVTLNVYGKKRNSIIERFVIIFSKLCDTQPRLMDDLYYERDQV